MAVVTMAVVTMAVVTMAVVTMVVVTMVVVTAAVPHLKAAPQNLHQSHTLAIKSNGRYYSLVLIIRVGSFFQSFLFVTEAWKSTRYLKT